MYPWSRPLPTRYQVAVLVAFLLAFAFAAWPSVRDERCYKYVRGEPEIWLNKKGC